MTISFESDNDVIVYALEKIVSYAREYRYFFVANCTWWIASIVGLDEHLRQHIDKLEIGQSTIARGISSIPRDIARDVSIDSGRKIPEESEGSYIPDPLRRTRKGQVNPLPRSKKQLKKARQAEARYIQLQK